MLQHVLLVPHRSQRPICQNLFESRKAQHFGWRMSPYIPTSAFEYLLVGSQDLKSPIVIVDILSFSICKHCRPDWWCYELKKLINYEIISIIKKANNTFIQIVRANNRCRCLLELSRCWCNHFHATCSIKIHSTSPKHRLTANLPREWRRWIHCDFAFDDMSQHSMNNSNEKCNRLSLVPRLSTTCNIQRECNNN